MENFWKWIVWLKFNLITLKICCQSRCFARCTLEFTANSDRRRIRVKIGNSVLTRGRVLKDVLKDTIWSPWLRWSSLGLGSKTACPRKCSVLGSRTALFLDLLKMGQVHEQCCFVLEHARKLPKNFFQDLFLENAWILRKICEFLSENLFCFFWEHCRVVSLGLGLNLEHSYPWPQEGLSLKSVSVALASDFFVSLAWASSLVSSTPPLVLTTQSWASAIWQKKSNCAAATCV